MNHLRELLDLMPNIRVNAEIPRNDWRVAGSQFQGMAAQAQCFWISELTQLASSAPIVAAMCRLPYDNCWFEWSITLPDGTLERWGCWARDDASGYFSQHFYLRRADAWSLHCLCGHPLAHYEAGPAWTEPASEQFVGEAMRLRSVVDMFLTALHCKNVTRQLEEPDAKLQKARQRRGKKPLFSYWTLHLDGRHEAGTPLGGTHESPRVHLRRGHPREFRPGEWTWVQPHMVGSKQAGMVHKDYAAGRGLLPAADDSQG